MPLPIRLEDWIEANVFASAKREGWFNAIAYYGIRDPRCRRAEECWAECVWKLKNAKPIRYPSFEEWISMAAKCNSTVRLSADQRRLYSSAKRVDPCTLANEVSRFIDWEALL